MSDTDDNASLLNREEKWILFNRLVIFTEKNKTDEFFSRNKPLNEEEKSEYLLYWKELLDCEMRKKRTIEEIYRMKEEENRMKEEENRMKEQENRIKNLELVKKKRKLDEKIQRMEQEAADLQQSKLDLETLLDNRYNFNSHPKQMEELLETLTNHNYSLTNQENQSKLSLSKIFELSLHVKNIFNQNQQDFVLEKLGLKVRNYKFSNQVLNESGKAFAPSSFTGINNLKAQDLKKENIIFGYPIDIKLEFPVVFCHQMFGDFLDIINDNRDNKIVAEYFSFLDDQFGHNLKKLNICYVQLFNAILSHSKLEVTISEGVTEAFSKLFGAEHVNQNVAVQKFSIDAMILLNKFPFAIIEFKDRKYSIDAVYQASQYYASCTGSYIDNFPSFIITIDRGFMFFYGVATVNSRIICDHLATVELTGCRSETNDSMTKFRRIIGALLFFHRKIRHRIQNISNENEFRKFADELNENFDQLNTSMNQSQTLFPAIFDIKNYENSSRIPIKFVEKILNNVYIVTCEDQKYILKLSRSYGLDAHLHLANLDLAPKIVGYEKKYGNYHLILMEYMDPTQWKILSNYQSDISNNILNKDIIFDSLKKVLDDFNLAGFVHGDFRNSNILMKVSGSNNFEFKFIDFDISGKINSRYANLVFKNPEINWPTNNFESDSERKIDHDLYMFDVMKSEMSTNH